jgi:hypothetical protein
LSDSILFGATPIEIFCDTCIGILFLSSIIFPIFPSAVARMMSSVLEYESFTRNFGHVYLIGFGIFTLSTVGFIIGRVVLDEVGLTGTTLSVRFIT